MPLQYPKESRRQRALHETEPAECPVVSSCSPKRLPPINLFRDAQALHDPVGEAGCFTDDPSISGVADAVAAADDCFETGEGSSDPDLLF